MLHEVRIRFGDLTYNVLKFYSVKLGIPITKVVIHAVYQELIKELQNRRNNKK